RGEPAIPFPSGDFRMNKLSLAVLCAAFVAAPALAQDSPTLKKIKDSGTITIGHRDSSMPFSYYDDQQKVVGYALDICMKVAEAFLMVETGRAVAFFMDDILLYSLVASSKSPADYAVGSEAYTVEPYGAMMPKDDPGFRKVVDDATAKLYKSGEMAALYDKWF